MPIAQWSKREKWTIRELEKAGFDKGLIHSALHGGGSDWKSAASDLSNELIEYLLELRSGRAVGRGSRVNEGTGETAIKAFAALVMRRFSVTEKPYPAELVNLVDYLFELDRPPPSGPYSEAKRREKALTRQKKRLAVAILVERDGEISNSELAKACGISTKTVSGWRRPPQDAGHNLAFVDRDFQEEFEALQSLPPGSAEHFINAYRRSLKLG